MTNNWSHLKNIDLANKLTRTEINRRIREIHKFINDNNIIEYIDLLNILLDNDLLELYDVAITNTVVLVALITLNEIKIKTQLRIIDIMLTNNFTDNWYLYTPIAIISY